ncbi:hypothetical protein IQ235_13055 [Oscillatoriales cyanobacterium LEGE 11467]|uniref:Uncharacterized protein n=1 Tax=Zarconia navalis LEGE 11467 TaxID=1828826 RepID=A0A928Z7R7_9CYAN|nr:hypothetical protein [Zarconia navalis]MBE9041707.1 hypothetical protein [Zarconia navalis LEGE 11467]
MSSSNDPHSSENSQTDEAPALYNPESVAIVAYFLTTVVGSWLILKNWRTLGVTQKMKSGKSWLYISLTVNSIALIIFFQGGDGLIYGGVLRLLDLLVWYFVWQKQQVQYIRERWGDVYPRKICLWR